MDEHENHDTQSHSHHGMGKKDNSQPGRMDHSPEKMDNPAVHNAHAGHTMPASRAASGDHSTHAGHGTDHSGHEQMFRVRFWWSLLLSIPVLLYSEMIQIWLGFTLPSFPFS